VTKATEHHRQPGLGKYSCCILCEPLITPRVTGYFEEVSDGQILISMQYFEPGVFFVKNLSFDKPESLIHGLLVSYLIAVVQAAQRWR
jgi:hypothetical protein